VVGRGPELIGASPVLAVARLVAAGVAEVDQGVEVAVAHGVHAAASPAVAAVRPAEGNELLAAKAHAAAAAVAGYHVDGCFVDELHVLPVICRRTRAAGSVEIDRRRSANDGNAACKKTSPGGPGLVRWREGRLQRLDRHRGSVLRPLDREDDFAVDQREQRVVAAHADIGAGVEARAALAHDDRAGRNSLAAEGLDAEHLRLGITAVPGGTAAF